MKDNFRKAKRILKTNILTPQHIIAINGCCYGQDSHPDKGEYIKLCGQSFCAFISGNSDLYADIIEPLGHKAKEKNELFLSEYAKVTNTFHLGISAGFLQPKRRDPLENNHCLQLGRHRQVLAPSRNHTRFQAKIKGKTKTEISAMRFPAVAENRCRGNGRDGYALTAC